MKTHKPYRRLFESSEIEIPDGWGLYVYDTEKSDNIYTVFGISEVQNPTFGDIKRITVAFNEDATISYGSEDGMPASELDNLDNPQPAELDEMYVPDHKIEEVNTQIQLAVAGKPTNPVRTDEF